jgi:hypothetical protein
VKCRPELITDKGRITLEMPQDDWFAGHTAWLEAFGIKDKGPVPDSITAEAIARRALKRYLDSVAQGAGNGKPLGRKRNV